VGKGKGNNEDNPLRGIETAYREPGGIPAGLRKVTMKITPFGGLKPFSLEAEGLGGLGVRNNEDNPLRGIETFPPAGPGERLAFNVTMKIIPFGGLKRLPQRNPHPGHLWRVTMKIIPFGGLKHTSTVTVGVGVTST